MAQYFNGVREFAKTSIPLVPNKEQVVVSGYETWVDIENSTTVRCGVDYSHAVTRTIGLTEQTSSTLKGEISSTIGPEAIAQIKSSIETTISQEINWSVSESTTKTFTLRAPPCGRSTITIYQLMRTYSLTLWRRKRWAMKEVWENAKTWKLIEYINCHDGHHDTEDFDEQCSSRGCKRPDPVSPEDGLLNFQVGTTNVRARFNISETGFRARFGEHDVVFELANNDPPTNYLYDWFNVAIPSRIIPAPLRFLGNITEGNVIARVGRMTQPDVFEDVEEVVPIEAENDLGQAAYRSRLKLGHVERLKAFEGEAHAEAALKE